MSGADRAINMALRVLGIGEVERDFKRVGDAGSKSFAQVEKSANGAAREVSEYTARLKRTAAAAKAAFANIPAANKGSVAQVQQNRKDFILGAVEGEKSRILAGQVEGTAGLLRIAGQADVAVAGLTTRMSGLGAAAGPVGLAIGAAFGAIVLGVKESLAAFAEHEKALAAFNAELTLTGNRSDATAADIQAMAERIVDSTGQTEAAALKGAQSLATVSGITTDAFEQALDASARYADAVGKELPDVIEGKTRPVLQALADKDLKALFEATEGLNDGLRATILRLAETGKTAEAQQVFIRGLAEAAGDGPGGLTEASNQLSKSWEGLKLALGEDIAGPAAAGMNWLAGKLKELRGEIATTSFSWRQLFKDAAASAWSPLGAAALRGDRPFGREQKSSAVRIDLEEVRRQNATPDTKGGFRDYSKAPISGYNPGGDAQFIKDFEARLNAKPPRSGGGRKGRGGGKSDADREAERLKREAEQARSAADKIAEANQDVIDSWTQRVSDIEAQTGLEGAALEAVQRHQRIEEAVRRLNTEAIDKQVDARRAEAAAAKLPFDEAAARLEATKAVGQQSEAVRKLAARYEAAAQAQRDFTQRQAEVKAILEQTRTPMEEFTADLEKAVSLLKSGDLSADGFDRYMDHLAERLAEMRHDLDASAKTWEGYGRDVSDSLKDLVFNGGSALEVLHELVTNAAMRMFDQEVGNPLADWIDGLTGNNQAKNVADARAGLPSAGQVGAGELVGSSTAAAAGLNSVAAASQAAATGLGSMGSLPFAANDQLDDLAGTAAGAAQEIGALIPITGQFGGALGSLISQLSAGAGGGGGGTIGMFQKLLGLGAAAFGGGGGLALGGSLGAAGATAGSLGGSLASIAAFASGTPSVPTDRDFYVGENGREKMRYHPCGRLEVISGPQTHREAPSGGGLTLIQHISIPERVDPRRTQSSIARGNERSLAMAARKGLAVPGRRR